MKRSDFDYNLPEELIAQYPSKRRGESRLLLLDKADGAVSDLKFADFIDLLNTDDILVFNNTRVIPARLYGHKDTRGRVEILAERILNENLMSAQVRASKPVREGLQISLGENRYLTVTGREGDFFLLSSPGLPLVDLMAEAGHVPLPPYIHRPDEQLDVDRFQTVYAAKPGAVAAPTAGLHFTREIMEMIRARGCKTAFVTLHISAGTFQPVRVDDITQHKIHSEYFQIGPEACAAVNEVKESGGRVIAIGTTSVRVLESATGEDGRLGVHEGETGIFIYPGYCFKTVNAMVTNFHLPESTLLMLVCAFAGRENVLNTYQHAIAESYRFYSYGDAMFIR